MKNIQYLLSVLFLINCSDLPQIENDLITLDLKGKVKSIVEFSYPKLSTNWDYKDIEYHFDINGFTKKKIDYDYNTYTIFNYGNSNKISQANQYSLNDSLMYKGNYKYENQELKKREVLNLQNDIVYTAIYDYSNSSYGNILVDEKEYDSKGNLLRHSSNLQNQKKQDLKWNEYNLDGKIEFTNDLTYNDKGKVIEYVKKDSANNLKWKWNKIYNDDNLEIERKLYNPKSNKESIRISAYEFDNRGNWIIKYLIQNNDTLKTVKREIKYFD